MKGAELSPPPLPTTVHELAAWQVFADQLTEQGNRLGPYLAYELSLGKKPTKEQLAAFHKLALRTCKVPRQFHAAWMLGQVRVLTVTRDPSRTLQTIDGDTLLTLRDLFPTPQLRQLERLVLAAGQFSIRRRWKVAMRSLPKTCRTLQLHAWVQNTGDVPAMIEGIPEQLEVLRVVPHLELDPTMFVSDRFAWVDLRAVTVTPQLARMLGYALRTQLRVKVRVGTVEQRSSLARLGERVVLGAPDDAALIEDAAGGASSLLERWTLEQLQQRYGIVSARAQVLRELPETYRLGKNSRGFGDTASWTSDAVITRNSEGWWVHATGAPGATPSFALNGARLGEEPVALKDGDRLTFNERSFRFVSRGGEPVGE